MTRHFLHLATGCALLALPWMAGAAMAQSPTTTPATLNQWTAELAEKIEAAMVFPHIQGVGGGWATAGVRHVVDLIVAPDGRIVAAKLVSSNGHPAFRDATRQCLERVGALSPLPAGNAAVTMRVHLLYAASATEKRGLERRLRYKAAAADHVLLARSGGTNAMVEVATLAAD